MDNITIIFSVVLAIVFWAYKRVTKNHDFFEGQGIAHEKPVPVFGNILPLLTRKEGLVQFVERLYSSNSNEK